MKYDFIQSHSSIFAVKKMCHVFKVSRSGYYHYIHRDMSNRATENSTIIEKIKCIHKQYSGVYGSPRMYEVLKDNGFSCSKPRVARLMRLQGIYAKTSKKFKVTTQSDHKYPISPNLLKQDFKTDSTNKIWISDITYIWTLEGWLYLTTIIDLYNRKVIGWSMSNRLTTNTTTIPALQYALRENQPLEGLIFHSDRGVQYASNEFRRLLRKHSIIQSMSGKGNCYDNAVAESFFHTLKTELVYHERYKTRNQARNSLFEYIETFYNRVRKHSALGYKSPEDYGKLNYRWAV